MTSRYVSWRPGDHPGPARFGLDNEQWRRLLIFHAHVQAHPDIEYPEELASPRLRLIRYLVQTGAIHEG